MRHLVFALLSTLVVEAAPPGAGQPASRQLVIEAPGGGDCARLKGTWKSTERRCTALSLTLNTGDNLIVRGGAHLHVRRQFNNSGGVTIGDQASTGELTLGEEGGVNDGGVNNGVMIIVPTNAGRSSAINLRLLQFVNIGTITNFKVGQTGGILNNFGEIINSGRINNRGFLHNSGPKVQTRIARIVSQGASALLSNTQGGIIENLGQIRGPVAGPCPGDCRR